jgi:hypothetical protein
MIRVLWEFLADFDVKSDLLVSYSSEGQTSVLKLARSVIRFFSRLRLSDPFN